jgi:hypothetical protein
MNTIFYLDNNKKDIINEYIEKTIFEEKTDRTDSVYSLCCNTILMCCDNDTQKSICYNKKDNLNFNNDFTRWIYTLSLFYLRISGISSINFELYSIECIKSFSGQPIHYNNKNTATIIFHCGYDKSYVSTHDGFVNCSLNDDKYIIVTFCE